MRQSGARERLARVADLAVPWTIALLYTATALELDDHGPLVHTLVVALGSAIGTLLAWRRQHPEYVAVTVLAAEAVYQGIIPEMVIPFGGLVAVWSLTVVRPPRVSLWGLGGLLAVSVPNAFRTTGDETLFVFGISIAVWALAEAARSGIASAQEVAKRAASDEQARIARELHDVIAHSVSVVVVQAAAADDVFDTHPDQARIAIRSIEETGRQALQELRRLLAGFRPDADAAPDAPQPGLAQLDRLTAPLRAAGLEVRVRREGLRDPLPAGVDLSAYRIVQEALTNALRHAEATTVDVSVRQDEGCLDLEVVDDGRGGPPAPGDRGGLGLVGMRERAVMLGGTFSAGPTPRGGFRVAARLPLMAP